MGIRTSMVIIKKGVTLTSFPSLPQSHCRRQKKDYEIMLFDCSKISIEQSIL